MAARRNGLQRSALALALVVALALVGAGPASAQGQNTMDAVTDSGLVERLTSSVQVFDGTGCQNGARVEVRWTARSTDDDFIELLELQVTLTPESDVLISEILLEWGNEQEAYNFQPSDTAPAGTPTVFTYRPGDIPEIPARLPVIQASPPAIWLTTKWNAIPNLDSTSCGFASAFTILGPEMVNRLSGPTRVETAVDISEDQFPAQQAGVVVLASADNFPDALAAGPLAVGAGGPLLLTQRPTLNPSTVDEIRDVLVPGGTVYVAGGDAALRTRIDQEIRDLGYRVNRLEDPAAPNRFGTAVQIAETVAVTPSVIYVADGGTYPDAMAAGAAAASRGGVMVLSDGERLPDETRAYLERHPGVEVVAVGSAASTAVPSARRVAGANPYETSVLLAEENTSAEIGIARAEVDTVPGLQPFADGLAGGAHIGRRGGSLLLSPMGSLPPQVQSFICDREAAISIYGGPNALTTDIGLQARCLGDLVGR